VLVLLPMALGARYGVEAASRLGREAAPRLHFGWLPTGAATIAIVALAVAMWFAYANGAFVMSGPDVTGVHSTPYASGIVGLAIVAALAIIGGFIGGLVSWIGALLNTSQREDKTWFIVLLVLGLLSFGLVAMIAYVIAGPDGSKATAGQVAPAAA
jgi:hypothetical protein